MSIQIRPLTHAIGAEVTGLDLGRPLDRDQWSQVYEAWLKHIVLVFPGQQLSPEQLIAFAGRFGPLDDHADDPTYRLPDHPQIYRIGNYLVDGKMSRTKDTGRKWHSDHSYTTRPTLLSMLYCRHVPPVGGTTAFSNMYMAYDTLSDKLKAFLDGLEAVHDLSHYMTPSLTWKPNVRNRAALAEKYPPVVQPVVRVHPETGRKALYVSEAQTSRFLDLTPDEGRGLLDFLFRHMVTPEFTYRHHYKVDDLVFWDNRCAQHMALADYAHDAENPRLMYRLTVLGKMSGRFLYEQQPGKAEAQAAVEAV
jgi:taurine dioxygenase